MKHLIVVLAAGWIVAGCATRYSLVHPAQVSVAQGTMKVHPSMVWNKASNLNDIHWKESWTQNGPLLDAVTFIGALPPGEPLLKQRKQDVDPSLVFRANMTQQELVSMVESYYRFNAGATKFQAANVQNVTFLNQPAVQVDYTFVSADEVKRRGRMTLAVVSGRLYVMSLDAAAVHYFDAVLPEFEAMQASASIGPRASSAARARRS